jgi:hypothetical protein
VWTRWLRSKPDPNSSIQSNAHANCGAYRDSNCDSNTNPNAYSDANATLKSDANAV